jgi:Asp-tRNA(Asn)/Glu-tRNA(Gln) amidotransferase A subunit family amidase
MSRIAIALITLALAVVSACGQSSAPDAPLAEAKAMPEAAAVGAKHAAGRGFHLEEATIAEIQTAILARQLTAEQLVGFYLARIKAYNGTCVEQADGVLGPIAAIANAGQINALQTLNLRPAARESWGFDARKARSMTDPVDDDPAMPDALETARELDRQFEQTGLLAGPLHGVVMAIKDQYDTVDMRTTAGADAFYFNDRPPDDATFVRRLREAGAIVLAKANLGEFASAIPRSAFGGTFCNPYDTQRSPGGSSSGSGSSVGANLVTCAIAEETGSSIRGPAYSASSVGISPTQELVSRDGMIQQGINTRVGPICRTVEDAAKVLDAIAGYDEKDELTAFSVGRLPAQSFASFAKARDLSGLRIGVVREYMTKALFTKEDEQSIDLVSEAAAAMGRLGATLVDPGPNGALFDDCVRRYHPLMHDKQFTRKYPDLFPVDDAGEPSGDHIATLIDLAEDPSAVPAQINFRELSGAPTPGQGTYWLDRYLRERGDANIRTTADFITKANYYQDPNFPDHRRRHERAIEAKELAMDARMQDRFAVQAMVLQCMAEMNLDAVVYPTSNIPPVMLGSPRGPTVNGRAGDGVWRFLGRNGFPVITVPAGFTTQMYDRVRVATAESGLDQDIADQDEDEDETELIGPVAASLPVGVDIVARPFGEPTLLRIAAAYEAATQHRRAPPGFGPLPGEP